MANEVKDTVDTLNGLIEICKDGQNGFSKAAGGTTRPDLQQLFIGYSADRAKYAQQLEAEVAASGEKPTESGSVSGAIHRGWLGLKESVTGNSDLSILEECERGEDVAVKGYREALAKPLSSSAKSLVSSQFSEVQAAHNKVKSLRDALKSSAHA